MKKLLGLIAATTLLIAGCSAGSASESSSPETKQAAVTVTDPWLKATEEGVHMTGVFGTLTNVTDADIHVVGVTSPLTDRAELHEMKDQDGTMVMVPMPDGFVIPAGGTFELAPGANHIMLMELMQVIEPGVMADFTLEFEGGGSFSFEAVARTYDGANETYEGDDGMDK